MTKPERKVIAAAMRWFQTRNAPPVNVYKVPYPEEAWVTAHELHTACTALRAARKKRSAQMKGKK